ncbi:hypothetical protein [Pseudomonas asiatica]|uniref:hypothetical protein n=1 Tax=Pseudomonas asiatica TaxID=2219225 RepID=UPI0010BFB1C3|nr:hypothetical protein [Pseudomonas asiatica]
MQRILKELTKYPNGNGPYFLRKRSWWRGIQIAFISGAQSFVQKTIARLWGETLFDSQPAIYPAERLRLDRDQPN